jgi:hypothetical protein
MKYSLQPRRTASSFTHLMGTTSILLMTSACGELPGFTVDAKTDDFAQVPVLNDKIDILFVVDNSGSMANEQANLASSFGSFIEKFSEKDLKFQVGVISTDVFNNANYWAATGGYSASSPYKNLPNGGPGTLLSKIGNDRIITPDSVDFISQFQENVQLGTGASGAEAGIFSVIKFFNPTLFAEGGWNAGFIRDEAFLAVIFVSDEDESWGISGTPGISSTAFIRTLTGGQKESRLAEFRQALMTAKNNDLDKIRVDSIVATTVAECPTVGYTAGFPGTGEVYKEAVEIFEKGNVSNICQDFSSDLESIGQGLVTLLAKFKLVQKPQGQIEVRVDGVVVPRDPVNGWEYLPETQEVEFRGTAIPNANSKITVKYVPGAPLE